MTDKIKHTISFDVEIDPTWIAYFTTYNDLFLRSYCGYWLRLVEADEKRGFLAWEDDETAEPGKEPNARKAIAAWRAGAPLPKGWFAMNEETAKRAWAEGVKRWGVGWYDDAGSERFDVVVQMALLGEICYG